MECGRSPQPATKRHQCGLCPYSTDHLGSMTIHQRTHTGERPFACASCGKAFTTSWNLQNHKRKHTGEKPFKCDACGKAFSESGHLDKHRRTHTGERPFTCALCGKAFGTAWNLRIHERKHTGEKPYECNACGRAFSESGHLDKHRATHAAERPFKCDTCGRAFAQARYLKSHRATHAADRPFECGACGKTFTLARYLDRHRSRHAKKGGRKRRGRSGRVAVATRQAEGNAGSGTWPTEQQQRLEGGSTHERECRGWSPPFSSTLSAVIVKQEHEGSQSDKGCPPSDLAAPNGESGGAGGGRMPSFDTWPGVKVEYAASPRSDGQGGGSVKLEDETSDTWGYI
ncbi:uncharacterized protein LOC142907369 isoform X2 [Petromyzon marinus]